MAENLIQRATSRADIIESLRLSYEKKSTPKSFVSGSDKTVDTKKPSTGFVDLMSDVLGYSSKRDMKSIGYLRDSLHSKAIILENLAAQSINNTVSSREKRKKKRTLNSHALSKSCLKDIGILDPFVPPKVKSLLGLHASWRILVTSVIRECSNEVQIQARLSKLSMIGGFAAVIDSRKKKNIGKIGFISSESQNCYYIAVCSTADSLRVVQNVRKDCIIGIFIPNRHDAKIPSEITKYGLPAALLSFLKDQALESSSIPTSSHFCISLPQDFRLLLQSSSVVVLVGQSYNRFLTGN